MKPFLIKALSVAFFCTAFLFTGCDDSKQTAQAPPQVPVVRAEQMDVPVFQEFVGQVYGIFDIPIRARAEGWLEHMYFEEGGVVSKGQLLYTIDQDPFLAEVAAAQSHLAEALTYKTNAQNELNRYKPLAEINAVSKSDLDAAQAAYDASVASVDAAKAQLNYAQINLSYCQMRSPINGIIGKTKAKVGEFVGRNPNPVILNTVSRIDTVRVEFFLTENDYLNLARLAKQQNESIEEYRDRIESTEYQPNLELILSDGTVHKHKGKADFIDREVNPETGALLIQASFPNPERLLRPGQFGRVKVKLRDIKDAVIIPQRCLIELQGQFSVLVATENNVLESRNVTVGPVFKDYRVVSEGLKADEIVVIEGVQRLRPGMTIQPEVQTYESRSNP